MMIPFGEWLPDVAEFGTEGTTVAKNVVPRTTGDYGPLESLSTASGVIGARCQGAFGTQDGSGNVFNFAGDAADLYCLSSGAWRVCSAATAGYTCAADDAWEFAQLEDRVYAVNGLTDQIQTFLLGTSTFFSAAPTHSSAPSARHIANIEPGFIIVGNTTDENDGNRPWRVWWSAFDDGLDWPTPGTTDAKAKQSDFTDLPNGGWVQKITGAIGGASGAIFMERAIYRIDYAGPPPIFDIREVERARGTPAPNSVINQGSFSAYLGEDGFYVFDGQSSTPIGAGKIDKTFFKDLDQTYYWRVWGAHDPINNHFYWAYPGSGNIGGIPNKLLIFNWRTSRWAEAEIDSQMVYDSFGVGYTLDGLDQLGYTMETLPASLDSRAWAGGRPNISAFNSSNQLAYFSGANMEATIETGEFPQSERVVYVDGLRPIVDGGTPTLQTGYRSGPGGGLTWTPAQSPGVDEVAPQRIAARHIRARCTIPSGSTWEHALGVEPRLRSTGYR